MVGARAQLEYAPGAPIRRRRRVRRVIALVFVVGLSVVVWRYHAVAWRQAKVLYHQHRCLTYAAPADQVVYDEGAGGPSPLMNAPGFMPAFPAESYTTRKMSGPFAKTVALREAPEYADFAGDFSPPLPTGSAATLFMHELRTKGGLARLVVVTRRPARQAPYIRTFALEATVIEKAGLTTPPRVFDGPAVAYSWLESPNNPGPPLDGLRFYAGQVDPADPAHFTIRYDLSNQSGTIDGRLLEDGKSVSLKVRDGPALKTGWTRDVIIKD
jgi:hypothetical protein